MKIPGLLAIGLVIVISSGCATRSGQDAADEDLTTPNMTTSLNLGVSADAILAEHGKPLRKRGRTDSDGSKLEDWFYLDATLSFKDGNLHAFRPR